MICENHGRKPLVSILMSCYNGSRWLHEAIDSTLNQTYQDFEFILIDDGSTDETWSIIESYRDRDKRIIAISKKNSGLVDSLNVGILRAKGKWIARLDQDDLCEPQRIEKQVGFVHNHPEVVLLGTGCVEIDEFGKTIRRHRYPRTHGRLVHHLEHLQRFFPHSSAFYHTDKVRSVGGYNRRIYGADDKRLWMELALQGKMACLSEPLVKIRRHPNQMSLDDNGKRQFCDGVAATVCHLLRKANHRDPSICENEAEWDAFLEWVEERVERIGIFDRRREWMNSRAIFFAARGGLRRILRFAMDLQRSGYGGSLVWEKLFGLSLPKYLAQQWMTLNKQE